MRIRSKALDDTRRTNGQHGIACKADIGRGKYEPGRLRDGFRQPHTPMGRVKRRGQKARRDMRIHRWLDHIRQHDAPLGEFRLLLVEQATMWQEMIGSDLLGRVENTRHSGPVELPTLKQRLQPGHIPQLKIQIFSVKMHWSVLPREQTNALFSLRQSQNPFCGSLSFGEVRHI